MRFQIQIHEAVHQGIIESPEGFDSFPHSEQVVNVTGRGLVIVTLWREIPPPLLDRDTASVTRAQPKKAKGLRKAKART